MEVRPGGTHAPRRSRLGVALLLSLVLHGLVGLWWRRGEFTPARPPASPRAEPLSVEFLERESPLAPPAVSAPPVAPPRPGPRRPSRSAPAERPSTLEPMPPPRPATAPDRPAATDAPREVRLFPGPAGLPVAEGPFTGGHTWRPGEGPSPEQRLAEERERVRGRVQGFLEDDLAVARVEDGLVDPYFSQMDQAMEKGLTGSPLFEYQDALRYFLSPGTSHHGKSRAANHGASGSPDETKGGPVGTDRLVDRSRANTAGARPRVQPWNPLGELEKGGAATHALSVELELEQSSAGRLLGAKLLRASGNALFDAYVLDKVPASLAALGPASGNFAARARSNPVRSVWQVRGEVNFTRTLGLSKLHTLDAGDTAYISALLATGMMAASFEETRGEVMIPDLRRPHFDIHTQLLRVY